MGLLVGLIAKKDMDIFEPLDGMLVSMKKPVEARAIIGKNRGANSASAGSQIVMAREGCAGLGYLSSSHVPSDFQQPMEQFSYTLLFNGRLYPFEGTPDCYSVAEYLGPTPDDGVQLLLNETNGAYALAVLQEDHLLLARDPMGVVPLYIGENEDYIGVASERKALWSIGIENPQSFPPGHVAKMMRSGVGFIPVRKIKQPESLRLTEEEAVRNLQSLLYNAVDVRTRDLQRIAVGFSGGLDSSLLACLADACGIEVNLISIGIKGSKDLEDASEAAEKLGMAYFAESFDEEDVERSIDKALMLVEEPDPLKLEVAIPIMWVAEKAAEMDHRVLFLGQGCDELFGGYRKYVTEYIRRGANAAQSLMFEDVAGAYERNFERDVKVSSALDVELRLPFADWDLVQFAISLPVHMKLPTEESGQRKRILRTLAISLGIPTTIVERKKRAIQYSTRVDRVLRKMARSEGLSLTEFVRHRFQQVLVQLDLSPDLKRSENMRQNREGFSAAR